MRKLKIAAFMPHPDDTEILVGGTLLKYKAQGHDVHVVIAMDGRRGRGHLPDSVSWQEIVAIRHEEARRACAILGVEPIFLDIEDHRLLDDRDCYEKVITAMESLNPDVVFTCAPNDYHNDHRCLSRLVLNSAWAPVFFAETSCGVDFNPDFYVDITEFIETKIEMARQHQSQFTEDPKRLKSSTASARCSAGAKRFAMPSASNSTNALNGLKPMSCCRTTIMSCRKKLFRQRKGINHAAI